MRHESIALGLLLCSSLSGAVDAPNPSQSLHVFHHENVLGTSLELKVMTESPAEANRAETAALAEIDRLTGILSAYDASSEVSRWLRTSGVPVKISPELYEVLSLFDLWRTRSDGALDAAAETVCRLWRSAATQQRLPEATAIAAAVAAVKQRHWQLDPAACTGTHLTDSPLVFNSFAKSYIASHACDAAAGAAKGGAMVLNIGGDLVVRGTLTETVRIANPKADAENDPPVACVRVRNQAVATSGNYRRGVDIGGKWFSHIVDPRSGQPVDHVISATVIAPTAADAGALATACCVLQPAESLRLVATIPGAQCLLLTKDGRRIVSGGWDLLEIPQAAVAPATPADSAKSAWDETAELVVNLELSRFDGRRAARPFVAVWIEDPEKYPVRTLALWHRGERWLPDLKAWQHDDQLRAQAEGTSLTQSLTSATRSPGKYSLKWDGKDNAGKLVKSGKYAVCIEAAREHGTHQIIRQEMDFNGVAAKVELKGNVEISSASLDYHHKGDAH